MGARTAVAIAGVVLALANPQLLPAIRQQDFEVRLERALAVLDSTETERGAQLLRALLASLPPDAPQALRVRAQLHLGAANWALGLKDSAAVQFRDMVRANPFAVPDPELFNPEIVAAWRAVKRATPAVALLVASDTTIKPDAEPYLVAVGVGRPDEVTVRLARTDGPSAGAVGTRIRVDSTASFALALRITDSLPLAPGRYQLTARLALSPRDSASVSLQVTSLPVDTLPHETPLDASLFRPESRKGSPVAGSAIAGLAIGAAAAAIPVVLHNSQLGGNKVQIAAISVGAGISVAGFAGVFVGRRLVPITENVTYNRSLIDQWEARNGAIAARNELARRWAPLRVQVLRNP